MFTGLVEGRGCIESFDAADGFWRLVVNVPDTEGLELGASVAIDGVCLTAVAIDGRSVLDRDYRIWRPSGSKR